MEKPTVLVIGATGTIGEPLTALFSGRREHLGIGTVLTHKYSPNPEDRSRIHALQRRGALVVVDDDRRDAFRDAGIEAQLSKSEALECADVIIDCTPRGWGREHKERYYARLNDGSRGFIAQGSEFGFGKPYAYGVNDTALIPTQDHFIQVVSCNTHTLAAVIRTAALRGGADNLIRARFEFMRRANDISQDDAFVPAPTVSDHDDDRFGTHHARDGYHLFATLGMDLDLFSSAIKVPTQYMHTAKFMLHVESPTTRDELLLAFRENPRTALTLLSAANRVFAFGRDHGYYGRILNNVVVHVPSLHVSQGGHEVRGWCFTPQDGNSLISSVAATLWLIDPETYLKKMRLFDEPPFSFQEV